MWRFRRRKKVHFFSRFIILLFVFCRATAPAVVDAALEPFQDRTVSLLLERDREKTLAVADLQQTAASFSYGQALVARKIAAAAPDGVAPSAVFSVWRKIAGIKISYKAAELLGRLYALQWLEPAQAMLLLEKISPLPHRALETLELLVRHGHVTAYFPEALLPLLTSMKDTAHWAAQQYFSRVPPQPSRLVADLAAINGLSSNSAVALESCLGKMDGSVAPPALLSLLSGRPDAAAWAVATMCRTSRRSLAEEIGFAHSFLLQPPEERTTRYLAMSDTEKSFALHLYEGAAGWAVGRLNRLHGVTDGIGAEFNDNFLFVMPDDELLVLFHDLAGNAAADLTMEMERARQQQDRKAMVRLLKKVARDTRRALVRQLSDVELFVLLAVGEPLYDSSFRDVVVPELLSRRVSHAGIMAMAKRLDPRELLLDRVLVNLARRGVLLRFLGKSPAEEKKTVQRINAIAFSSVEGALDFSVSLERIVPALSPNARLLLVEGLAAAVDNCGDPTLRQLFATMAVFFQEQLSRQEKNPARISRILASLSRDALVTAAPFASWAADGKIRGLSMFQADDDGWRSFDGFCRELLQRGYRPEMAADLPPAVGTVYDHELRATVAQVTRTTPHLLRLVHRLLYYGGGAVDFVRDRQGVKLVQTVSLNLGEERQQQILRWYLSDGMEILSQRGHSYWRRSQILAPMASLRNANRLPTPVAVPRRFVSLGSCGSMKAYWETVRLFDGSADVLATVGVGASRVNDLFTILLAEFAAAHPASTWGDVREKLAPVFDRWHGRGYIAPWNLPYYLGRTLSRTKAHTDSRQN